MTGARPAAGSTAVRTLLEGPAPPGARVLAVLPTCLYVGLPAPPSAVPEVLAVETSDAVGLPCALVVGEPSAGAPFRGVRVGDPVRVGAGAVRTPALDLQVVRWWVPPRPVRRGGRLLPAPADAALPALEPAVAAGAGWLGEWLRGGPGSRDAARAGTGVRRLVGLGGGLTPAGDDVLAGALVALAATRPSVGASLAASVAAVAAEPGRTTSLSVTLLRNAGHGLGIRALVAYVDALTDPAGPDVSRPLARLLAVGHSSGAALAHGVALALGRTARRQEVPA